MKTKEQIEALRVALIKAVAEAKKFTNVEDGGTSNFDNPIINLYGWKDTEVREAFKKKDRQWLFCPYCGKKTFGFDEESINRFQKEYPEKKSKPEA